MAIVVVGGHTRNIGKTSVVAGLIAALPEFDWTAFKITQFGHGICSANGKPCSCETGPHTIAISEERDPATGTDSARFLAAGAVRSFWVRTRQGQLADAMPRIRKELSLATNAILESNSILQFLKPDLYLTVLDPANRDFKSSAKQFLERADAVLWSGNSPHTQHSSSPHGPTRCRNWRGTSRSFFLSRPRIHATRSQLRSGMCFASGARREIANLIKKSAGSTPQHPSGFHGEGNAPMFASIVLRVGEENSMNIRVFALSTALLFSTGMFAQTNAPATTPDNGSSMTTTQPNNPNNGTMANNPSDNMNNTQPVGTHYRHHGGGWGWVDCSGCSASSAWRGAQSQRCCAHQRICRRGRRCDRKRNARIASRCGSPRSRRS